MPVRGDAGVGNIPYREHTHKILGTELWASTQLFILYTRDELIHGNSPHGFGEVLSKTYYIQLVGQK